MMKLYGFLLQLGAILGIQLESLFIAIIGFHVLAEPILIMFKKALMSEGFFSIGTAESVHLKKSKVHAQLNLFLPVLAFEAADDNLARLVLPLAEQVRNVKIHRCNYWRRDWLKSINGADQNEGSN